MTDTQTTEFPVETDQNDARAEDNANEGPTTSQPAETEKIEDLAFVEVPVSTMLAALKCASNEETRYYLNGVFLHRAEDRIRMVATDGHRLFVASHARGENAPELPGWLDDGVIVHSEGLAAKLNLISKLSDIGTVRIGFGRGQPRVVVTDYAQEATFRCMFVEGTFPDYQRVVEGITGGMTESFDPARSDLKPVTFGGAYLKGVSEVAKALAGKNASVSMFAGGDSEPQLITFPDAPGAMMVLMPQRCETPISGDTVALVAPAVKGTLGALRAHVTRNTKWAEEASDPSEKAKFESRAADYQQRIDDLLSRTLEQPQIEDKSEADGTEDGQPLGEDVDASDKAAQDAPQAQDDAAASDTSGETETATTEPTTGRDEAGSEDTGTGSDKPQPQKAATAKTKARRSKGKGKPRTVSRKAA